MNKNSTSIIIAIVLGLLVIISIGYCNKPSEREFWQVSYEYKENKRPYDRDFFIDLIRKSEGKNFHELEERFSVKEFDSSNNLYFYFDQSFHPDATESNAILRFAESGNTVFIAANDYSSDFFAHLRGVNIDRKDIHGVVVSFDSAHDIKDLVSHVSNPKRKTKLTLPVFGNAYPLYSSFDVDTTEIDSDYYARRHVFNKELEPAYDEFIDPDEEAYDEDDYYEDEEVYVDEDEYYDDYETEVVEEVEAEEYVYEEDESGYEYYDENTVEDFPVPAYKPLSEFKDGRTCLLKIKFGKGTIYLHSAPVLFTNSQLDKPEIFAYINGFWKDLDYDNVYWDQLRYQFLNDARNQQNAETSYFKYIYKNRALKTASIVLLIGLIVFILAGIKRKYEAVPVVEPLRNSSIDFARTIARLYWLKPNHRVIALKKVNMFLYDVRSRYGLSTHSLDAEFREKLMAKSGVQAKYINRLFDSYGMALNSATIHEDVLIRISQTITYIKRNWK